MLKYWFMTKSYCQGMTIDQMVKYTVQFKNIKYEAMEL